MISALEGYATIFMLHRVSSHSDKSFPPNDNMKVSDDFLKKFIVESKERGYRFISLDCLHDILKRGDKTTKNIVMTMDDGYADNYSLAYPIFKKFNIPFVIYVTTSFPDGTAILWWYVLEELIFQNSHIYLTDGSRYLCDSAEFKIKTFMEIRKKIISLPRDNFIDKLQNLFFHYNINWHNKVTELALTWENLVKMSKDPLVTIGAHTITHPALNLLSKSEIIDEAMKSKELIESHIGKKVEHFCYPFGGHNEVGKNEFAVVKNLGFKTATTTRFGNIYSAHKNYLEALPRVMLKEDFSWYMHYMRLTKSLLLRRIAIA